MTHITLLDSLDIAALTTILVLIGDELRMLDARRRPLLAFAFCLIAIGSFVGINFDLGPGIPKWWDVVIDVGISIYVALLHRRLREWERAEA